MGKVTHPLVADRWAPGITATFVGSPLSPHGMGGTSFPTAHDPSNRRAWHEVESGHADWAEVYAPGGDRSPTRVLFRAWRISPREWAWQSSSMGAPAFMPYVDCTGTLNGSGPDGNKPCTMWLVERDAAEYRARNGRPDFYGMTLKEWNRYGLKPAALRVPAKG